jgi:transcriptional repressor NrdR
MAVKQKSFSSPLRNLCVMKCPFCKKETKVLESRESDESLRRRRECVRCGRRFTTYERIETTNILVVKRNGDREQFNREKLHNGILRACQKRPVSSVQIAKLLDDVEEECKKSRSGEVASTRIGELVMQKLKKIDKVAYIRFASVYLDFKDPEDFEQAMKEVAKR